MSKKSSPTNAVSQTLCYKLLRSPGLVSTKGIGLSSVARYGAGVEADDAHIQAATILGQKLQLTADRYRDVLNQQFDAQVQRSVWDVTYGSFRNACMGALQLTVNAVSNRWEQILLIYAGFLRINLELQHAGGDVSRQNEFAGYVARFLDDHDFGTWVQEQGGWVRKPYCMLCLTATVSIATPWRSCPSWD